MNVKRVSLCGKRDSYLLYEPEGSLDWHGNPEKVHIVKVLSEGEARELLKDLEEVL